MKYWNEINNAQRVERWENVLRVLEALPTHERRQHFDMSTWGYINDCGTVACAAGHCGLDPWFRRRGFEMKFKGVYQDPSFPKLSPGEFFGLEGHRTVFVSPHVQAYTEAVKATKQYLRSLRAEARLAA